jgi:hypothetical protein
MIMLCCLRLATAPCVCGGLNQGRIKAEGWRGSLSGRRRRYCQGIVGQ